MPLFEIASNNKVHHIGSKTFQYEKQLQDLIEANLLTMFGVHFIASEFHIYGEQPGYIDTIGLDADGAPTIIEYKRNKTDSVINQGLYYMNWLVEHRGDFVVAARDALGHDVEVNWSHPRLIIIAQEFAKWDTYAVKRMGEGIELWRYILYGDNMLYLEMVYGQQRSQPAIQISSETSPDAEELIENIYTLDYHLARKSQTVQTMFHELREGMLNLASEEGEIIETPNKLYISYRHGRNFAETEIQQRGIKIHLDIPYSELDDPRGLARDVSNIGHWGTGDVEVRFEQMADLTYILQLIEQSYRHTL